MDFTGGKVTPIGNPLPKGWVLCNLFVNSKVYIIYIDGKVSRLG